MIILCYLDVKNQFLFNFAKQKNEDMKNRRNYKLGPRLLVLLLLMAAGLIISTLVFLFIGDRHLLTMLTIQDVLTFIIPAVVCMALFHDRPLHVMGFDKAPSWMSLLLIVAFYIISMPGMNWLVHLNEGMTLPSWMSGIEQWMRTSENEAAETTKQLLDIHSIGSLLPAIFVIGFMAGLSEETLFRGAMLRTMQHSRLGTHAAVWIAAIVFSAIHMQFYGFVPRLILGLWMGYLLVWTGSLWVPIIAHTLNNSTVVVFSYLTNKGVLPEGYGDNLGLPEPGALPWLAIASVAVSIAIAVWAHRHQAVLKR